MKILITADPELPVPPVHYGGIERMVDMLQKSLLERGHEITLIAHRDSEVACNFVPWPGPSSLSKRDTILNVATLTTTIVRGNFDLVHSFSRIAYMLPLLPLRLPKLMTYQREVTRRSVTLGNRLSRGTLHFSAISQWMMRDLKDIGTWHLVPNGVPLSSYDFKPRVSSRAPLVFLGRIEEIKGPHIAIEVAKRTGLPLVIAGNIPKEYEGWFQERIAPHLDGDQIKYVGPVDDVEKNELLGRARAFLMPILWEEPFGIVMAEAMACGTPVLGFRRGSVPEVVTHGETGFVVDTTEELVEAVGLCDQIDRRKVRRCCETRYSDDRICDQYVSVYSQMLQQRTNRNS